MTVMHYESYTAARYHFKDLLDSAAAGRPTTVRRESGRAAVVDAERLRYALSRLVTSRAEVVAEAGGWSSFIPGLPIAADGATFDDAIDSLVEALREYADDWVDHLRLAPNHHENWGLVQLVSLSDDGQLLDWLLSR